MKASVITLHAVLNYGSVLQTYATQKLFEKHGFETEIVDYRRDAVMQTSLKSILLNKEYGLVYKAKLILMLPSSKKSRKIFDGFFKRNVNLTDICYREDADFEKYPIDADVYCTGSDQVWNTGWHNEIPKPFYLTYAPDDKRIIAFSASFGKEALDDWEKAGTKELLDRYDYISVREKSAVGIVEDLGIKDCEHVLDPTLAINPQTWYDLAAERVVKEKYILVYQLNNNVKFDEYAERLAKEKNLKLIRLCTRYDQLRKTGNGVVLPTVEQFLALFRDAECVITDSFHATSFSLIFNKKFINIFPELYSTRLASILELTGLEERKLTDFSDFSLFDKEIAYTGVKDILNIEREKTEAFLTKALKF